jgi:hypothetical protein
MALLFPLVNMTMHCLQLTLNPVYINNPKVNNVDFSR